MKKQISTLVMAFALCNVFTVCFCQDEHNNRSVIPKWISDKGYWIIESNIKTPKNSIIHFHNNQNILVYREKIEGIIINLEKRKVLMNLKKVLEQSATAWEKGHLMKENGMLLTLALKK